MAMARSLDDLLTFCLDEIAVSGEHGINPSDLYKIVTAFYDSFRDTHDAADLNGSHNPKVGRRIPVVDHAFLERVWKWLTRHPDVYVGRHKEGNQLSLTDVENRNATDGSSRKAAATEGDVDLTPAPDVDQKPLRVYITEERTWWAICGHGPDATRVFPFEFTLLSIIASRRSKGILQGDLVRLSGQDKRSVPGRTDSLRDKGYIEKRAVLAKGSRTSLLILKRFTSQNSAEFLEKDAASGSADTEGHSSGFVDQVMLIHNIFDIVRQAGLILRDDLKNNLGLKVRIQWKLLSRIIRRFEAWGCLRRVNAASTQSASFDRHYPCIKYLRDPTEEEIDRYCTVGASRTAPEDLDIDAEGEDDEDPVRASADAATVEIGQLQEVSRALPSWNPDRLLPNLVTSIIDTAGVRGMTMVELKTIIAGPLYSRPIDFYVGRLVESWITSQPSHLRHLSIIRDTAMDKKTAYFRHYMFEHFEQLVEKGGAFWEGVVIPGRKSANTQNIIAALLSKPEKDEFGFPVTMQPFGQYDADKQTVSEMMRSIDPGRWVLSSLDPVVVQVAGHDEVRYGIRRQHSNSVISRDTKLSTPRRPRLLVTPLKTEQMTPKSTPGRRKGPDRTISTNKTHGRPRKYERGMEKFWRVMGTRLLRSRGIELKGGGIMSHPLVKEMMQNRPGDFDNTYTQALQYGAPTPLYPVDITEEWVDKTKSFLKREAAGVYVSPIISITNEFTNAERFKRLVVIKSSRLSECSFSDLRTVKSRYTPKVHFFISSVAHTLHVPRKLPSSSISLPIGWLIPTSSGSLPQPPVPALSTVHRSIEYLPSVAAHTISHLKSVKKKGRGRGKKENGTAQNDTKFASRSKGSRPSTSKAEKTTSGPVMGVFESKRRPATKLTARSPSVVSAAGSGASSMPPPLHRRDGTPTPTPTRGPPRIDDFRAQGGDSTVVQPDARLQINLRQMSSSSAKKRENLVEGHDLCRKRFTEDGTTDTRDLRTGAFASSGGTKEVSYLNAPTPGVTPRAVKISTGDTRLLQVGSSSLVARATDVPVSSGSELPNQEGLQEVSNAEQVSKEMARTGPTSPMLEEAASLDRAFMSSGQDEHGHSSVPTANNDNLIQDHPTVGASVDQLDEAKGSDEANDSDATVDLGPEKFFRTHAKRKQTRPVTPSTPRQSRKSTQTSPLGRETSLQEQTPSQRIQTATNVGRTAASSARDATAPVEDAQSSTHDGHTEDIQLVFPNKIPTPSGRKVTKRTRQSRDMSSAKAGKPETPEARVEGGPWPAYQPRKKRRLDVWEGSIGYLRKKLVTDIIDKCNGVVPFGYPLWYAFATAWIKFGRETKPDFRTLKTAVKGLVASGEIKHVKFSFKDKNGLMTTQAMLVRAKLKITDDAVREVQRKIIDAYPRPYKPEEFEVNPDLRLHDSGGMSGLYRRPVTIDNELVQTDYTPQAILKAAERKKNAELRERIRTNAPPQRRPPVELAPKQPRVQRLERIGGPHRLVTTKLQWPSRPTEVSNAGKASSQPSKFALPPSRRLLFETAPMDQEEGRDAMTQQPSGRKADLALQRQLLDDRKQKLLPHSLADIPDRRRRKPDHSKADDPAYSKFLWDLEKVEKWEASKEKLFDNESPHVWQFINHQLPERHEVVSLDGPLLFEGWETFNENGEEVIDRSPPDANFPTRPSSRGFSLDASSGRGLRRKRARTLFEDVGPLETDEDGAVMKPGTKNKEPGRKRRFFGTKQVLHPAKQRRVEQLQVATFDPKVLFPDAVNKVARGPQILKQMPEELVYKLLVTFAVVRILAGGVERYLDFSIVQNVFPDETVQFLKDRWRTMRNKYRRDLRRYMEDFQELYLKAYEDDDVPAFDYDDLHGNDWGAIVEWAMTVLEKPIQHDVEDLPASRADLDHYHKINVENGVRPVRELYAYNIAATVPHKEAAMASTPFAIPIFKQKVDRGTMLVPSDTIAALNAQPPKMPANDLRAIARSWVIATILTPDSQFAGAVANAKISTLPDYNTLLEQSVKSLLASRVISNSSGRKGDRQGARAYDISEQFLNTLSKKRIINHEMLRRALWYKINILDPAFLDASPRKVMFDMAAAEDGDMVAVLNLAAEGRIIIRPSKAKERGQGVPGTRYGLIANYQTRFMEKDALKFAVEIELNRAKEWIAGNPLLIPSSAQPDSSDQMAAASDSLINLYPPPRGAMDLPLPISEGSKPSLASSATLNIPSRLPLYFSIHSTFLPTIWTMLVAAIVGLIANRPGISTKEVETMLTPVAELEDVRMVLEWLKRVGAVERRGMKGWENGGDGGESENWETREWWWCVCEDIGVEL